MRRLQRKIGWAAVGVLAYAQEESDAALLALIHSCSIQLHTALLYRLIACMLLWVQQGE
jgi:hypothetical protein